MHLNKQGENISIGNVDYKIGMEIVAINSVYAGLTGRITEIRSDEDKETDNPNIDIYCDFNEPKNKDRYNINSFDSVIMSPVMLIERVPLLSVSQRCDLSIDIFEKTNDGNDLDPRDLKLTKDAVNGFLNECGEYKLKKLHDEVMNDRYKQPYFHNVEHMTIDHEGYVYYKGKQVEHYSPSWAYSEEAKKELITLKMRCEYLEQKKMEITYENTIWKWNDKIYLHQGEKRFRDEKGQLSMPTNYIAKLTQKEANSYYVSGEHYIIDGEDYKLKIFTDKDCCGNDVDMAKFEGKNGNIIFIPPEKLGTFLPDVASVGMEIVKAEPQQDIEMEEDTEEI